MRTRRGVYWSRSRDALWVKGESSGALQELVGIALDCDRDALKFVVRQSGSGFCHKNTWTCWGEDQGLGGLARRLRDRADIAPEGSYTKRVLEDPKSNVFHKALAYDGGILTVGAEGAFLKKWTHPL